jgi:hypothetical protein
VERVSGCRSRGFRAFKGIRPRLNIEFQNLGLKLLDGTSIIEGVTGRSDAALRCAAMSELRPLPLASAGRQAQRYHLRDGMP